MCGATSIFTRGHWTSGSWLKMSANLQTHLGQSPKQLTLARGRLPPLLSRYLRASKLLKTIFASWARGRIECTWDLQSPARTTSDLLECSLLLTAAAAIQRQKSQAGRFCHFFLGRLCGSFLPLVNNAPGHRGKSRQDQCQQYGQRHHIAGNVDHVPIWSSLVGIEGVKLGLSKSMAVGKP